MNYFYQQSGELSVFLWRKIVNMNKETKQFISENFDKDVHQLSLRSKQFPMVNMPLALRQIVGRQKIQTKIPRFFLSDQILYPEQLSIEQSSSETTAKYKSTLCEGNTLVDLTGGFGVDCCFMASHFKQVTYVERYSELCKFAIHNFKVLGENHISVINSESEKHLLEMEPVDWIYIDPSRRSSIGKKLVLISDCEPNVAALSAQLMQKANKIMLKISPMMDISAAISELAQITEIHILAVENECKEIILILSNKIDNNIIINTINFSKNSPNQIFRFGIYDESETNSKFTTELGKYLYEPNAAVMKSGAFKLVGNSFGLLKIHINTHLYTSNKLEINFPGRIFEVNKVWGNSKNEIKELVKLIPKANITIRNYPLSVEELRKKLKIKDGGNTYLFACTSANEQKIMIECKKVKI